MAHSVEVNDKIYSKRVQDPKLLSFFDDILFVVISSCVIFKLVLFIYFGTNLKIDN